MNLALLIVSLLSGAVQGVPNISSTIKQIIADISGALSAIVKSGATTTLNPTTVLEAIGGIITALQQDPNLPAPTLALLASLYKAIDEARAADAQAQLGVDPTKLQPIPPLP